MPIQIGAKGAVIQGVSYPPHSYVDWLTPDIEALAVQGGDAVQVPRRSLTAAQAEALADLVDPLASFCRWCIPGRDAAGAEFRDVSGRGNHATVEASNSGAFATDARMATVAHGSAGGLVVPLAATDCDLTTDSVIMAVSMLRANPGANDSVMSFGASAAAHPGLYLSHRSAPAGVARIVGNRGNGTLVSGADSTLAFSNAGGTREVSVVMAFEGPSASAFLLRDGVLTSANPGLMSGASAFTVVRPLGPARLGGTHAGATVACVWRGWQAYVFTGRGLPLNLAEVAAKLAEAPSVKLPNRDFVF